MALNMDALGKPIGPITRRYDWKDVVLYALGVGAGFDDLDYAYEKNLKVIPTFSIAMIFDFLGQVAAASNINLAGVLHGEQELIFHRPIPTSGSFVTTGKVGRYYDKGPKGALVIGESETCDAAGKRLFTNIITIFARLDGGFGGEDAPKKDVIFPDRDPDVVVTASPSPDQPLLYRLSGDIFQLHADPEFARMVGFEKPIMHGLCTYGYACRALMAHFIPGEPEKVRRLACRFSRTLYPGEPIKILIWKTQDGKALWRVVNAENGEMVIDNGIFEYGPVPKDEIRFDGRVAVITGAGGGLGRVYALELARRGARVVVNDFGGARDGDGAGSASPADQVVNEIRDFGGEAVANYASVATPEGGENIIQAALDAFGRVDILINNAGILRDKGIGKMEPENWKVVLDVHLNGAYHVTRPAFRAMREKGYGRIIMTTSAAGLYGNYGQTNYSAAKMGLVGLMNTLKLEGGKYNIKVNTVAPIAASRLTADILPPDLLDKMKPEFVSPLVLYLCSEQCPVSGKIYNAGMGYYNRAAVMTSPGVMIGDGKSVPSVEDVAANWEKILSLKGAREYEQLNDLVLGDMLAALQPKPDQGAADASAAGAPASVAAIFEGMSKAFRVDAAKGVDVVFQFSIGGEGGGDWVVAVKDGTCKIETGVHGKPTTTIKMAGADFLAMMSGKLTAMKAYTSGKIKIEGDLMKSQLIEKLFKI
ncbi:MAG: short-chain dehydrogenase [Deltaproteobacteria bacterium HGW-Deltaproteobacteria-11]|nr:MAG: short-chain dehydrogenase [Deltaproteobacteria bacterium HGW-Deltaproteobacteria-11]